VSVYKSQKEIRGTLEGRDLNTDFRGRASSYSTIKADNLKEIGTFQCDGLEDLSHPRAYDLIEP
jgi:hypothetical protein